MNSGQRYSVDDYSLSNKILEKEIDILKITKELLEKVEERQKIIKIFYNSIKNSVEFKKLENADTSNALLVNSVYGNQNMPEILEHMIEDESYDEYGPGSGSRFIIKNSQILSYNINENKPQLSMIEVQGQFDSYLENSALPSELQGMLPSVGGGSGNSLTTAVAVDYDIWRMYGFGNVSRINVPFLKDPKTQLAPYAAMLLSNARKNILTGSITISGNEYMQPGDVVYIEEKNMLFYVTSVSHTFSFSGGMTTTLQLTYGHLPGEFIPTKLDIIGKVLYNNKEETNFINHRQSNTFNEDAVGAGCLSYESNHELEKIEKTATRGFSNFNSQLLENIIYNCEYRAINAATSSNSNIEAVIELRTYYDNNYKPDIDIGFFIERIKKYLENPPKSQKIINIKVNSYGVNMSDNDEYRSPSQKAFSLARQVMDKKSNNSKLKNIDKLRLSIYKNIVDIYLKFEIKKKVPSATKFE